MTKYIKVSWPECQDYMQHPRWNECIFCIEIEGHPCSDSTYMIPEDLYDEINNKFIEHELETNLGTILVTEFYAKVNNELFFYNREIKKDDKVLLYDTSTDEYIITSCTLSSHGVPYMFEGSNTRLTCKIIGSYNVNNFEYA